MGQRGRRVLYEFLSARSFVVLHFIYTCTDDAPIFLESGEKTALASSSRVAVQLPDEEVMVASSTCHCEAYM
jgi:hypothetical protein